MEDRDPAVRRRAVEVLADLTRDQAGDQWSRFQRKIATLAFMDKDRGVRTWAAMVLDLAKFSSPERRRQFIEQMRTRVEPTATRLRLVDSQDRPVAGALLSTYWQRDRDKAPSFTAPESLEETTTDARGEATLKLEIEGHLDGEGVYAIRQEPGSDRPLVGVHKVTRAEIGKSVTIVMQPGCRVVFRVECPAAFQGQAKPNVALGNDWWRAAYVMLGDNNRAPRPLFTHGTSGEPRVPPSARPVQPLDLWHGRQERRSADRDRAWAARAEPGSRQPIPQAAADQRGVSRYNHHWAQPDPRGEFNAEVGGKKILLRPVKGFGLNGGRSAATQHLTYYARR